MWRSIQFAPDGPEATVVTITESTFPLTEEGFKRSLGPNGTWTYTLCGLKAHVQFGINLRTGLNKEPRKSNDFVLADPNTNNSTS